MTHDWKLLGVLRTQRDRSALTWPQARLQSVHIPIRCVTRFRFRSGSLKLRNQFQTEPSQNLVRALLVSSAHPHDNVGNYVDKADFLNTVGYGEPNVEYCWSTPNRTSLVAEDRVGYRTFHVYSLVVPEDFLHEPGTRSISVALAYDPPTRLSRRDYIATAMWLGMFGGLTSEQVVEYRSKYDGDGEPPRAPDRNKLKFSPAGQTIRMSTVQKRSWSSNRGNLISQQAPPRWRRITAHLCRLSAEIPKPFGRRLPAICLGGHAGARQ